MLNRNAYKEERAVGIVTLVGGGGVVSAVIKSFNPRTGERLPDEMVAVNIDDLNSQLEFVANEYNQLVALVDDAKEVAAAPVPPPTDVTFPRGPER